MKKTTSIKLHPDTVAAVMEEHPPSLSEGIERVLRRALGLPARPHGKPGNPQFGPGYGRGRKQGAAVPPLPQGEGAATHPDNLPPLVPLSPCGETVACGQCIMQDDCTMEGGEK